MGAAENKKIIQDAFSAWSGGDGGAFFNLLADDVTWTVIGSTAVSRTYKSKREFLDGAARPLGQKINGSIQPRWRHSGRRRQSRATVGRSRGRQERHRI